MILSCCETVTSRVKRDEHFSLPTSAIVETCWQRAVCALGRGSLTLIGVARVAGVVRYSWAMAGGMAASCGRILEVVACFRGSSGDVSGW